jgi:hypothetical protein
MLINLPRKERIILMNKKHQLFKIKTRCLVICLLFNSCATVLSGFKQTVVINSFPPDATVYLNGVEKGLSPIKLKLKKGYKRQEITLKKANYKPLTFKLTKSINPFFYVNVGIGTYPALIDIISGSAIRYSPTYHSVHLQATSTDTLPVPRLNEYLWNKHQNIEWELFRGKKRDRKTYGIYTLGAMAHSDIYYFLPDTNHITSVFVYALFNTDSSWAKYSAKSNEALIHEQGHFNITEIYARKFRKALSEKLFDRKNCRKEIEALYDTIDAKRNKAQNDYDIETTHHTNTAYQKTWDTMIADQLKNSEKNENTKVVLHFK